MMKRALILCVLCIVTAAAQTKPSSSDVPRAVEIYMLSNDDQSLLHIKRAAIEQAAAAEGYQLTEGLWQSRAIESAALGSNLLLQYERSDSAGLSLFSILVSRSSGQLRVFPILRQGVTAFKSAYAGPAGIRAYNEMFPPLQIDSKNDAQLAARVRCYMAMTGYGDFSGGLGMVELSVINEHGKNIASLSYRDADNTDWRFLFTPQGVLTGVKRFGPAIKSAPETIPIETSQVPAPISPQQTTAPATDSSWGNPHPVPEISPYGRRQWTAPPTIPQA
jgi:hypothetical protein